MNDPMAKITSVELRLGQPYIRWVCHVCDVNRQNLTKSAKAILWNTRNLTITH